MGERITEVETEKDIIQIDRYEEADRHTKRETNMQTETVTDR